ncbi:MAG: agmatinase [Planctomycetota bacterium]|nr:agmatinase [Planctomycetota bacterium]
MVDVPDASQPVDWLVYGAAHDAGVTFRPGARFGPRAIREASQYLKQYHLEHRVDVPGVLSLADAGDAPVQPYLLQQTLSEVASFAAALPPAAKLLALGGDHSIAYANMKATRQRLGERCPPEGMALVHFDSHLDTVDAVWGERFGHASVFIRAIEEKIIDPSRMISIGIKGPLNTPSDLDYAQRHGVTLVTGEQHRSGAGRAAIEAFLARTATHPTYLTFDIDVVDPAFAPGTGTPCPGGMSSAEALAAVRQFAGVNLVGGDVVEVLPDRDVSGITAFLAAHVAFEILAIDALRAQRERHPA